MEFVIEAGDRHTVAAIRFIIGIGSTPGIWIVRREVLGVDGDVRIARSFQIVPLDIVLLGSLPLYGFPFADIAVTIDLLSLAVEDV